MLPAGCLWRRQHTLSAGRARCQPQCCLQQPAVHHHALQVRAAPFEAGLRCAGCCPHVPAHVIAELFCCSVVAPSTQQHLLLPVDNSKRLLSPFSLFRGALAALPIDAAVNAPLVDSSPFDLTVSQGRQSSVITRGSDRLKRQGHACIQRSFCCCISALQQPLSHAAAQRPCAGSSHLGVCRCHMCEPHFGGADAGCCAG